MSAAPYPDDSKLLMFVLLTLGWAGGSYLRTVVHDEPISDTGLFWMSAILAGLVMNVLWFAGCSIYRRYSRGRDV